MPAYKHILAILCVLVCVGINAQAQTYYFKDGLTGFKPRKLPTTYTSSQYNQAMQELWRNTLENSFTNINASLPLQVNQQHAALQKTRANLVPFGLDYLVQDVDFRLKQALFQAAQNIKPQLKDMLDSMELTAEEKDKTPSLVNIMMQTHDHDIKLRLQKELLNTVQQYQVNEAYQRLRKSVEIYQNLLVFPPLAQTADSMVAELSQQSTQWLWQNLAQVEHSLRADPRPWASHPTRLVLGWGDVRYTKQ